jgi:hypothetical protein
MTGDTKACTNRTLHGDYGSSVEGLILPAPGVTFPIRGVVMTHYDGKGTFTQVDHIVFNGTPPTIEWTPGTGTYRVNADCTGTAHIATNTGWSSWWSVKESKSTPWLRLRLMVRIVM